MSEIESVQPMCAPSNGADIQGGNTDHAKEINVNK